MNEGYEAYKKYLSIKLHFTKDEYDYFKYNGEINAKYETFIQRNDRYFFVKAARKYGDNITNYFAQAGLITLVLNLVMMIVAYFIAQLLASGAKQKICITIECGLQNGTLAIFVATSIFGGGIYVIPAATYSLIMFVTSLIFVYFIRKTS